MAWDSGEDYAYTKNNNIVEWAWEFIRRNPRYRKQWEEKLAEFYIGTSSNQEIIDLNEKVRAAHPDHEKQNPRNNHNYDDPSKDDFRIISERTDWGLQNNEWSLLNYYNPDVIKPDNIMFNPPENLYNFVEDAKGKYVFHVPYSNSMVMSIKIGLSLKSQLDYFIQEAKKLETEILGKNFEAAYKSKTELWTLYIRLLDAKVSNATPKDIQKVLFSGYAQGSKEKYKQTLKQAKNMVKEGYKDLVLSAQLKF